MDADCEMRGQHLFSKALAQQHSCHEVAVHEAGPRFTPCRNGGLAARQHRPRRPERVRQVGTLMKACNLALYVVVQVGKQDAKDRDVGQGRQEASLGTFGHVADFAAFAPYEPTGRQVRRTR